MNPDQLPESVRAYLLQLTAQYPLIAILLSLIGFVASSWGVISTILKGGKGTWNWLTYRKPAPPPPPPLPLSPLCEQILAALHDPRCQAKGDHTVSAPGLLLLHSSTDLTKGNVQGSLTSIKSVDDEITSMLLPHEREMLWGAMALAHWQSRKRAESIVAAKAMSNIEKAGVPLQVNPRDADDGVGATGGDPTDFQVYMYDLKNHHPKITFPVPSGTLQKQSECSHHPKVG